MAEIAKGIKKLLRLLNFLKLTADFGIFEHCWMQA